MELPNENYDREIIEDEYRADGKHRHGCVTAWLVFMIVANALMSLAYFFSSDFMIKNSAVPLSTSVIMTLGVIGIANVFFAVMLLKWKKLGFWGFVITSIAALGINVSIGLGIMQSIIGLVGIVLLYAILQIKQDKVSAWNNLE